MAPRQGGGGGGAAPLCSLAAGKKGLGIKHNCRLARLPFLGRVGALILLCALPWVAQGQTERTDVDEDDDGLIEVRSLIELHNMRYNLAGTSYRTDTSSVGNSQGCNADAENVAERVCRGYELVVNLDFDADGDGKTWLGDNHLGYELDSGDHHPDYFPVTNGAGGWQPIGDNGQRPFTASFDGNNYVIRNLATRRPASNIGLFGAFGRGGTSHNPAGNGGTIRNLGLVDNLADYTGSGKLKHGRVGGLVGEQNGGSITTSYATGDAFGGDGNYDYVGGLVGYQWGGSIRASFATGNAAGSKGAINRVGGLVGLQILGSITASYATGIADGGRGSQSRSGGLLGTQQGGSLIASYATGAVISGKGANRLGGALVGQISNIGAGSITASYGFGEVIGATGGLDGAPPVSNAAVLTEDNAGESWNSASHETENVWDFGDDTQIPLLKHSDDTLLPGQLDVIAGGPSAAEFDDLVELAGALEFGRSDILSWHWQQLQGTTVSLMTMDAEARTATFRAPAASTLLTFKLTATADDGRQYTDRITFPVTRHIADRDGDGLIEIHDLLMLHNMRHNLKGTSYKTNTASVGNSAGCPTIRGGCFGYELTQDLDFDTDDDGTWFLNEDGEYRLDPDDHHDDYFPVDDNGAGGWVSIGDQGNPFAADLEGNSYTISNLAIRRSRSPVGFLGTLGRYSDILNLGLIDNLADYTGSSSGPIYIGGLVGIQYGRSKIVASYTTGHADGGDGKQDHVGGLVGWQNGGSITASYATGAVTDRGGNDDYVGGLVGWQSSGGLITASHATGDATGGNGGEGRIGGLVGLQQHDNTSITASYATGDATGGGGSFDRVGGLVGWQHAGSTTASYATGDADGGEGDNDYAGGLVGWQSSGGLITASHATGNAAGGNGDKGRVGGLVGLQQGSVVTASYATGDADGGGGDFDRVGGLVGWQHGGSTTASYATGDADGGKGDNDYAGGLVGVQNGGGSIAASYATGDATGGNGNKDRVGGLVGWQQHDNTSITASYATGNADGGNGNKDRVGGLIGYPFSGSSTASYGFGRTMSVNIRGVDGPHATLTTALQLTAANAGDAWDNAGSNTLGAWNFGTPAQTPVLNYADYDGAGTVFDCDQFPVACGTLLPAQQRYATLEALELSGVVLQPAFTASVLAYTSSVANDIDSVVITATPTQPSATVVITALNDRVTATGNPVELELAVGKNIITLEVDTMDGSRVQTYTLTLTREPPMDDATLNALGLEDTVLQPAFAASVRTYVASVTYNVESIAVAVTPAHTLATAAIMNDRGDTTGNQVELAMGENIITIEVTAADRLTVQTYTLILTRESPAEDAMLRALELDGVTLQPAFAPSVLTYTASVGNDIDFITVTAMPNHTGAVAATLPADADGTAAGHQVGLTVGENIITLIVTAEDGSTVQTYTLTLTRESPAEDAMLRALELDGVTLQPAFASSVLTYTASVAHSVESIAVAVTLAHALATVAIMNDRGGTTGNQVELAVGENIITIEVTAADGNTVQRYTLTLTRESPAEDAMLRALELDGVTLQPAFASSVLTYTASVAHSVESIAVAVTLAHALATVAIMNDRGGTTGNQVELAVGENIITIEVTAEDGSTVQTYTLTLTREPSVEDATLRVLELDGATLQPAFASSVLTYTVSVANDIDSVAITATPTHASATVAIATLNDNGKAAGPRVELAVGENTITLGVTAADGRAVQTYTLTLTRLEATSGGGSSGGGGGGGSLGPSALALFAFLLLLGWRRQRPDLGPGPAEPGAKGAKAQSQPGRRQFRPPRAVEFCGEAANKLGFFRFLCETFAKQQDLAYSAPPRSICTHLGRG